MKISIVVMLVFLLFSNVGSPKTPTSMEAEVLTAAAAIIKAFGNNDRDTYFTLFDPAATFIFYSTPYRLNDVVAYQKEWTKWEKESGFRVRSCKSSDPRVQLFGDTAIFTHSVSTDISTTQGNSTLNERETIVFHRINGRWIAVHEHLSPLPEQKP